MYKAEFEVEAITPIFMRGADQRKAEIRASSIKGLMRWWFRALAHGVLLGNLTENEAIEKIKNEENKIFGSTKERSKFNLYVEDSKNRLRRVEAPRSYFSFGISGYGLIGTFNVNLRILDDKYKDIILATFLTFGILGSIGQRSRRAFGSITVKNANTEEIKTPFKYTQKEIASLLNWSTSIFEEYFGVNLNGDTQIVPTFPAIHPNVFRIKISDKNYSNWKSAVKSLSKILRTFREDKKNLHSRVIKGKTIMYHATKQYYEVKKAMSGNKDVKLPYSAFGLPHQYNFFSMNIKSLVIEGIKHSRRASSLSFKIVKHSEFQYVPIIMFFNYIFLPNQEKLQIRLEKEIKAKGIQQPTLDKVKGFFEWFRGTDVNWR
ncbi:type III-B CRISPR module RAMP protein Cmr1 [Palaeococcus sp. (in: euryarchaeotes)]